MLARIAKFSGLQVVSQVFSASTIFVLSVLVPASPLATYGLALSIGSLLSSLATLRIEQAIAIAEDDADAAQLAWLSALTALALMSLAMFIGPILLPDGGPIIIGALSGLSLSLIGVTQQVFIRQGKSVHAGKVAATRSLIIGGAVVVAAYFNDRSSAIPILQALGAASAFVSCACLLELRKFARTKLDWSGLQLMQRKYRYVWLPYLGESGLSSLSQNAPYFVIFHVVDHKLAAAYLLADRLVRVPIGLLSNSVRSHLTHQFRLLRNSAKNMEALHLVSRWSGGLALIGLVGLALLGIGIAFAASYKGNEQWLFVGHNVLALTLWASSVLSNPPARAFLTANQRNIFMFRAQGVELVFRLLAIVSVIQVMASNFSVALFVILVPGVVYNLSLYLEARKVGLPSRIA